MMPPKQPKISQKLVVRTAIGLLVLAGLIFGYQYLYGTKGDIDFGSVNSVGWIAAVQQVEDGSKVVYFDGSGAIHPNSHHVAGATEKDPVWRGDGNRIYFSSDQKDGIFQIFRWNLWSDQVENRAPGHISRTNLQRDPFDNDGLLFIEGGLGFKLSAKAGKATRVFPPVEMRKGNEDDTEGEGPKGRGTIDFGMSDKYRLSKARWLDHNWLIGIQRLDNSEVLIAQTTDLQEGNFIKPFVPLLTGKHIAFDVNPDNGTIVCVVDGFMFNENDQEPRAAFVKGNKIVPPFRNALFRGTLEELSSGFMALWKTKKNILLATQKDEQAFGDVSLSPDGEWLAFTTATSDPNEAFRPSNLVVAAVDPSKGSRPVAQPGEIFEPSWSPDSQTLVFTMRDASHNRLVYTMPRGGGQPKLISPNSGIFTSASFSPQVSSK